MSISERLRTAMRDAGFESQKELERASGVKQPTINRILNRVGSKGPESETVKQLARACGVSFEWLNEGLEIGTDSIDVELSSVPEVDRQFGRRVKAAREAAGLTQTELGVRMKISPQGVQKWESGASSPRFSRLYGLASVLGVPVSRLLPDDPMSPASPDGDTGRLGMLAARIHAMPPEKQRALAIILEATLN